MPKKKIIKISLSVFISTIFLLSIYYLSIYCENKNEQNLIKEYFNTTINDNNYNKINNNNYIGILEIPAINLRKGFYNIDNKNNNPKKENTNLKIEFDNNIYENTKAISKQIDVLYKTENLLSSYYLEKKEKNTKDK